MKTYRLPKITSTNYKYYLKLKQIQAAKEKKMPLNPNITTNVIADLLDVLPTNIPTESSIPPKLQKLIRALLQAFAGFLITHGYFDSTYIDQFLGVGLMLASYGWSVWDSNKVEIIAKMRETVALKMNSNATPRDVTQVIETVKEVKNSN